MVRNPKITEFQSDFSKPDHLERGFWTDLDPPRGWFWAPRTPPKWGTPRIPDPPGIGKVGLSDLLYQENGVPLGRFRAGFSKNHIKPSRLGGF